MSSQKRPRSEENDANRIRSDHSQSFGCSVCQAVVCHSRNSFIQHARRSFCKGEMTVISIQGPSKHNPIGQASRARRVDTGDQIWSFLILCFVLVCLQCCTLRIKSDHFWSFIVVLQESMSNLTRILFEHTWFMNQKMFLQVQVPKLQVNQFQKLSMHS